MVYTVGIPAYFAWSLFKRRKELDNRHVLNRYGFLYAIYRRNAYLWDVWEMLQKMFLTGVIALIFPGKDLQVAIVLLADLVFLCVLLIVKPHIRGSLRNLSMGVSVAITLTMFCGLVLKTVEGVNDNTKYRIVIDLFLVTMNGSVTLYALTILIPSKILYHMCERRQNRKNKKKLKAKILKRGKTLKDLGIHDDKKRAHAVVRSLTSKTLIIPKSTFKVGNKNSDLVKMMRKFNEERLTLGRTKGIEAKHKQLELKQFQDTLESLQKYLDKKQVDIIKLIKDKKDLSSLSQVSTLTKAKKLAADKTKKVKIKRKRKSSMFANKGK